jgi:hypothetical protein
VQEQDKNVLFEIIQGNKTTKCGIVWNYVELCAYFRHLVILLEIEHHNIRLNLVRRVYNCSMLSQWMPRGVLFFPVQKCDLVTNRLLNRYVELCGIVWNI